MSFVKTVVLGSLASFAAIGATSAAAQEDEVARGKSCAVSVQRDQDAGVLDLRRQVLENGECRCLVNTGPASQARAIEERIAAIVSERACPGARPMGLAQGMPPARSGFSTVLAVGASAAVLTGALIVIDDEDNQGPGPRVSP